MSDLATLIAAERNARNKGWEFFTDDNNGKTPYVFARRFRPADHPKAGGKADNISTPTYVIESCLVEVMIHLLKNIDEANVEFFGEEPFSALIETEHSARVRDFMIKAGQDVPPGPFIPSEAVRILRAKLIIEEALETVDALGVMITAPEFNYRLTNKNIAFASSGDTPDLVGIVDGCADVSVVTIGTLIACGVKDGPVLRAVDANNLAKFGPGHSRRADGKLIKPPGHKPPDILKLLVAQGYVPSITTDPKEPK